MKNDELKYYNIKTLKKMTGVEPRTIRYYIQRGLLQKPEGGGRGHYYTDAHLERIKTIRRLSKQGVPLEKMREFFSGVEMVVEEPPKDFNLQPFVLQVKEDQWKRVRIGPDVEVSFRAGAVSEEEERTIKNFIISIMGKNSVSEE